MNAGEKKGNSNQLGVSCLTIATALETANLFPCFTSFNQQHCCCKGMYDFNYNAPCSYSLQIINNTQCFSLHGPEYVQEIQWKWCLHWILRRTPISQQISQFSRKEFITSQPTSQRCNNHCIDRMYAHLFTPSISSPTLILLYIGALP